MIGSKTAIRKRTMSSGKVASFLAFVAATCLTGSLTACGNNSTSTTPTSTTLTANALSGRYTFLVTGTNATDGDYSVAGSFTADGKGGISSGVADYSLGSGIDSNVPLTGTYTVSGGVATILLTDSAGLQDSYTTTLFASGGSQVSSVIAKTDGTGTGTLYSPAIGTFTPAGSYTYALKGEGQGVVAVNGSFVAATSGTFSSGSETFTDGKTTISSTATGGFLYPAQANGRGQAAIGGNSFSYYPTSANQVVLIGLDDSALLYGTASKQ